MPIEQGGSPNVFDPATETKQDDIIENQDEQTNLLTDIKDAQELSLTYLNDNYLEISAHEKISITRVSHINKFGANNDISSSGNEDIWDNSTIWVPPTTHRIHDIVSSSANDSGVLVSSGTVDSGSTTTLVDSSATFVTDGVAVGDVILNDTNYDHSTITAVTETTLTFETSIHASDPEDTVSGFNANDSYRVVNANSTGVSVVHIYGLDANMEFQQEFIIMNGTTNVPTLNTYYRIYRMHSDGAASRTNVNIGNITATAQTDGTITAQINIGNGTTAMAIYTVPKGKTAYMTQIYSDIVKPGAVTSNASLTLRTTPLANIDGTGSRALHFFGLNEAGSSNYHHPFRPYKVILENTDIWIRCDTCSANGTAISAGFDLILVNNN